AVGAVALTPGDDDDLATCTGLEHPGARVRELPQPVDLVLEAAHPLLEVEDPLDAGEVDALLDREPLHLTEQLDVTDGVAPAPAAGAGRGDDPEAVVLAQRLRVHARELGGHRDDEDRQVLLVHVSPSRACASVL